MKNISKETQELVIKELEKLGEYDSAEYLGEWNGYDVFSPTFEDLSNAPIIGIPPFFLIKNNKLSVVMYGVDSRFETIEKSFN